MSDGLYNLFVFGGVPFFWALGAAALIKAERTSSKRVDDVETKLSRGVSGLRARIEHIEQSAKIRNGRINHRLRRLEKQP